MAETQKDEMSTKLKGPKILQDDRTVTKRDDGMYEFTLLHKAEYSQEQRDTIVKDMEEKLAKNKKWLENFEKIKSQNVAQIIEVLEANKAKLSEEVENLEEGLKVWKE